MYERIHPPMRVFIADEPHPIAARLFLENGFEIFQSKKLCENDFDQIAQCDALLVRASDVKDKTLFQKAEKLKAIARAGTGYDNINRDLATKHDIVVMNAPDGNAPATAELAVAHMLNLARHISAGNANMRKGTWSRAPHKNDFQLRGKTLGIIGCGRIGSLVARFAKTFGMRVVVYDPYILNGKAEALGGTRVRYLRDLLQCADIITLHPDLNDETRKIINAQTLRQCKKGVFIVNCARGPMVDADALAAAIREGHVANAAFDVIENEPTTLGPDKWKDNPLLAIDKVVFTPHVGGTTKESLEDVARQAAEQIIDYLREGIVMNAVNEPYCHLSNMEAYIQCCA